MEHVNQLRAWKKQIDDAGKDLGDAANMGVAKRLLDHAIESHEQITKLREQLADSSNDALGLIETIKYLKGIAERGTGSELPADKTVESFVLEYVKNLESSLRAKDAVIEKFKRAIGAWDRAETPSELQSAEAGLLKTLTIPTDSTQILDEVRREERERVAEFILRSDLGKIPKEWQGFAADGLFKYAEAVRAME